MFLMTAALVAALGPAPAQAQTPAQGGGTEARRMRAPDTDETVDVTKGTRLSVDAFAGEVIVRGWARDAVRVQARHNSRTKVTIRPSATHKDAKPEAVARIVPVPIIISQRESDPSPTSSGGRRQAPGLPAKGCFGGRAELFS